MTSDSTSRPDSVSDDLDTRLYSEEYFVVLAAGEPEEILTASELAAKLSATLEADSELDLPRAVRELEATSDRVRLLIDTTCELTFDDGGFLQWYAVRLEK
ncbi:MAG: chlororespiratory reduction protein 7 [Geitlerinemataceae cyanobacterium]